MPIIPIIIPIYVTAIIIMPSQAKVEGIVIPPGIAIPPGLRLTGCHVCRLRTNLFNIRHTKGSGQDFSVQFFLQFLEVLLRVIGGAHTASEQDTGYAA